MVPRSARCAGPNAFLAHGGAGPMADIDVEVFEEVDPSDALVILSFYSTGAAAPIAAQYLVKQLQMPLVGHVRAPDLGPVVVITDGLATSPIRIFGGDVKCTLDQECQRTYLVSAEIPVSAAAASALVDPILAWAKDARLVLCLDAVVREEGDETPDVYAFAASRDALAKLGPAQAQTMPQALIAGVTAEVMNRARGHGIDAGALAVEAARNHPDGRAAAALIERLDHLIPQFRVETEPLLTEALELEAKIQKSLDAAKVAQQPRSQHTFI